MVWYRFTLMMLMNSFISDVFLLFLYWMRCTLGYKSLTRLENAKFATKFSFVGGPCSLAKLDQLHTALSSRPLYHAFSRRCGAHW